MDRALYEAALKADIELSLSIELATEGQRDRWTLTAQDRAVPVVRAAYRAKVQADSVWLDEMRRLR